MNGQNNHPHVWQYLRVSTDEQDTKNQAQCVSAYASNIPNAHHHQISEEASTKRHWKEREIKDILDTCQPGDIIVVSEISRLARSTLECLEIFKEAAERATTIVAVKNGLTMDGSMASKIVSTVLAMAAEIERDMIRARTTEALARRKAKGLPMGRPKGATSESKLTDKRAEIEKLLAVKVGKSGIARLMKCSRGTLDRAIAQWSQQP